MSLIHRVAAGSVVLLAAGAAAQSGTAWESCAAQADAGARLACYDRWASEQRAAPASPAAQSPAVPPPSAPLPSALASPPTPVDASAGAIARLRLTSKDGCRQPGLTALSRLWELEAASDCGTFGLRGWRPTSISLVGADTVNTQPSSGNPLNNAVAAQPFRTSEMRLQLSVRSKVAKDLLRGERAEALDSVWFSYTQQSYWQLFTPVVSRPFRSTDHEPEILYIRPLQSADPGRWRLRYAGASLNHQSNGQALPLSRSWNRLIVMAGAERGGLQVQGRVWKRLSEGADTDDNPGIQSFIGRAELQVAQRLGNEHVVQATLRHNLERTGRGSLRLEWMHTVARDEPAAAVGGLQLHMQLFSGYGDSLLDFNRRRTVFSVGLSLADW